MTWAYFYQRRGSVRETWVAENDCVTLTNLGSGDCVYMARGHVEEVLSYFDLVLLSETYYGNDCIARDEFTYRTSDGEVVLAEDAIKLPNGDWHHKDELVEMAPNVWVQNDSNLEELVYIGATKTFAYADDVDLDDPDVVAVQKWLFWMLCFLPCDSVIDIVRGGRN